MTQNPTPSQNYNGRQATLKRGTKKIKRETQKFKRFFEAPPSKENSNATTQRDDCTMRKAGGKLAVREESRTPTDKHQMLLAEVTLKSHCSRRVLPQQTMHQRPVTTTMASN